MKNAIAAIFMLVLIGSSLSSFTLANTATNAAAKTTIVEYFSVDSKRVSEYYLYLNAGQTALVKATGNGRSDLDLYIRNVAGELIASDEREMTDGYLKFEARKGGCYKVRVLNTGNYANRYKLEINVF